MSGKTLRSLKKTAEELLNTIKVAIYIRVSTHWQVDKESLPVQRQDLISYCKFILNTDNYVIFEDPGYSAKNTDRPDFQKMMARVRTGEFTHILVWKIDRISRNLLDFAAMYQELKELGVTFVSKNEQFDTSTAIGEAMLKIILVFAELERHMTSERVTAAMLSRATNGKWNGGKVPFGYRYDKEAQEFIIDEAEARVVKLMYDLYDKQRSLLAVSKELNDRGYRSRKGAKWSPVTVGNLMRSPFYIGVLRYNYRDESGASFTFKPESEWIMFEEHHPQIITHEQWNRVVSTMRSQRRGQPGHGRSFNRGNVHIFAGLVTCGYCGSLMRATKDRVRADGSRPSIYHCASKRTGSDCPNKYISDLTIGPFVLNYIANIIRARKSFGVSTSIETLEKKLLRGDTFKDVVRIGRPGLEELYRHFQGTKGVEQNFMASPGATASNAEEERDLLLAEKHRKERALNRLKALYLYSEEEQAMSEAEYIVERKRLLDSLDGIDARLAEIDEVLAQQIKLSDEEFIQKASYFIMAQQLTEKRHIDYTRFMRKADPQIVKNFIQNVCANFCIKSGRVVSIRFKNGIEHQFFYRDTE